MLLDGPANVIRGSIAYRDDDPSVRQRVEDGVQASPMVEKEKVQNSKGLPLPLKLLHKGQKVMNGRLWLS